MINKIQTAALTGPIIQQGHTMLTEKKKLDEQAQLQTPTLKADHPHGMVWTIWWLRSGLWDSTGNCKCRVEATKKQSSHQHVEVQQNKKKALSWGDSAVPLRARCNEKIVVLHRLPLFSW